ncbi:MAG: hypothetical protein ABH829_02660 [archaeon]
MIPELIYFDAAVVVTGMLYGAIWNANVMMFSLFLGICLLSRYPKVAVVDSFIVIDLVDFFTLYTYATLGTVYGMAMLVLGCWLPQAYSVGESPMDTIDRMVSLFFALGVFAIALKLGVTMLMAITIGIFVSMMLWALVAVFIFHVPDPRFILMAVAKPVLFNRVLAIIGCC